jgi:pimeloyl-ACP methyl ester carboxylesterase
MDSLHIAKASFVGLSMGASTSTDFALAYPERISKLVLVAPGLSGAPDVIHIDTLSIQLFNSMDSAAATKNKELIAQNFTGIWCVGPFRKKENVDARAYQYVYNTILNAYDKHTGDSWPNYDPVRAAKRMDGFTKSTLLIEADADVPIIHDNISYIHRHIKNSRLVTIHGSAHMINLEKPDEFNKVVLSFLKEKD